MGNTLNIGSKISTLRKEKGWSQGELAKQIDASREIIGKYERNENLPSIEMVVKMTRAFTFLATGTNFTAEPADFLKQRGR